MIGASEVDVVSVNDTEETMVPLDPRVDGTPIGAVFGLFDDENYTR